MFQSLQEMFADEPHLAVITMVICLLSLFGLVYLLSDYLVRRRNNASELALELSVSSSVIENGVPATENTWPSTDTVRTTSVKENPPRRIPVAGKPRYVRSPRKIVSHRTERIERQEQVHLQKPEQSRLYKKEPVQQEQHKLQTNSLKDAVSLVLDISPKKKQARSKEKIFPVRGKEVKKPDTLPLANVVTIAGIPPATFTDSISGIVKFETKTIIKEPSPQVKVPDLTKLRIPLSPEEAKKKLDHTNREETLTITEQVAVLEPVTNTVSMQPEPPGIITKESVSESLEIKTLTQEENIAETAAGIGVAEAASKLSFTAAGIIKENIETEVNELTDPVFQQATAETIKNLVVEPTIITSLAVENDVVDLPEPATFPPVGEEPTTPTGQTEPEFTDESKFQTETLTAGEHNMTVVEELPEPVTFSPGDENPTTPTGQTKSELDESRIQTETFTPGEFNIANPEDLPKPVTSTSGDEEPTTPTGQTKSELVESNIQTETFMPGEFNMTGVKETLPPQLQTPNYKLQTPPPHDDLIFIGYRPGNQFVQTEPWSYPYVLMPKAGCVVRKSRPHRVPTRDVVEEMFQLEMRRTFPAFEIAGDDCIPVSANSRAYEADISLIVKGFGLNLFIDVEIDEPYDSVDRKPKHCLYENQLRDKYLADWGWIVIRFAEVQAKKQPKNCLAFIARVIQSVYPEYHIPSDLKDLPDPKHISQWTVEVAEKMAAARFREHYLDVKD